MVAVSGEALDELFRGIDLTGVFANAVLGGVLAREQRFDPIGFAALAIMSGLGGGIIRDTLLQRGTPVVLTDYVYILTALAGAAITFVVRIEGRVWDRLFPVLDALALGCWASAGASKTLALGFGWLPAVLLGTITAVGGGALRDIVLRRVPAVFGGNTLYATPALLTAGVMVGLFRAGHPSLGLAVSTTAGAGLTLLARWRRWSLPAAGAWWTSDAPRGFPRWRGEHARPRQRPASGDEAPDAQEGP